MSINLDAINIIILLTALVNTIYGLVVYSRNRHDATNISFFILTLSVSFWDITMFAYRAAEDPFIALICSRILYVAASTIPIAFLFFVLIFPDGSFKPSKWQKFLLPVPFIISCIISITPSFLIENVLFVPNQENTIIFNFGLHIYYAIYIISYFFFGYLILFKKYSKAEGVLKTQILFILIGTFVSTTIGVFSNLILLLILQNFTFNWLGQVGTVIMIISISYSILKYHLFNIRVIATELFTFSLWFFILVRTLTSTTSEEGIVNGSLLVITVVVGIFLIQSVRKEVEQRDRIEKLAADLELANVRLTELDRQKSEFVSFATHQLRAPLTAMKGYSSLLLDGDMGELPKGARDGIQHIFDSSKTLANIVDDYLNISRIELGTMKYAFETVDLKTLIDSVIGELKPNLDRVGLAFTFKAEPSAVGYRVTADRDKLKQVIANLIDNSVKYTPSGKIELSLSYDKPHHNLVFKIRDTGVGIDPEVLPLLFQKFTRAKNANRVNIRGTGLGLYVARQIVEAHQGTVHAESAGEGKGSTFIVELPPFAKV